MCVSGAAPLPVQVLTEFGQKFPFPLIEGYGLSEASPVVTKNPLDGVRKAGSIGLPIPNVEVSIQNDAGEMLPAGEIGEVCVRGVWQRDDGLIMRTSRRKRRQRQQYVTNESVC